MNSVYGKKNGKQGVWVDWPWWHDVLIVGAAILGITGLFKVLG